MKTGSEQDTELAARGLSGLSSAMGRNGGVATWRDKFETAEPVAAAPVAPAAPVVEQADRATVSTAAQRLVVGLPAATVGKAEDHPA